MPLRSHLPLNSLISVLSDDPKSRLPLDIQAIINYSHFTFTSSNRISNCFRKYNSILSASQSYSNQWLGSLLLYLSSWGALTAAGILWSATFCRQLHFRMNDLTNNFFKCNADPLKVRKLQFIEVTPAYQILNFQHCSCRKGQQWLKKNENFQEPILLQSYETLLTLFTSIDLQRFYHGYKYIKDNI